MNRSPGLRRKGAVCAAVLCAAAGAVVAHGQTIQWNNSAGGTFNVGSNWLGGAAPATTNFASFGVSALYPVTFTNSPVNEQLHVGAGTVTFFSSAAQTYTINGFASVTTPQQLTLSGMALNVGTLFRVNGATTRMLVSGGGDVTAGTISLSGGTVTVTGPTSSLNVPGLGGTSGAVHAGAALTFTTSGVGTFGAVLDVADDELGNGTGTLNVQSGATVTARGVRVASHAVGGTFGSGAINVTLPGSTFTQTTGSLLLGRASGGAATLTGSGGGAFRNGTGGAIIGATGHLDVQSLGTFSSTGTVTVDGGLLTRAADGNLDLTTGGFGDLVVTNSGFAAFSGDYDMPSGTRHFVTAGGRLTSGGVIRVAPAAVGVASIGSLTVDGLGSRVTADAIFLGENGQRGEATFDNGAVGLFDGGVPSVVDGGANQSALRVRGGASVTVSGIGVGTSGVAGSSATLTISGNSSRLSHAAGTNAFTIGAAADSRGTVLISDGGRFISGTGTNTINAMGLVRVESGGTMSMLGRLNNAGTLVLAAGGAFVMDNGDALANQAGGLILMEGGRIEGTAGVTNDGVIRGWGTIDINSSFPNRNLLRVEGGTMTLGPLTAFSNGTTGTVELFDDLDLRRSASNSGTINGSGGTLVGVGTLTNTGTITSRAENLRVAVGTLSNTSGTLRNGPGTSLFIEPTLGLNHTGNVETNAGGAVVFQVPITNAAARRITMVGGNLVAPAVTNAGGGTVSGFGQITSDLTNNGTAVFNGPVQITGDLTNAGWVNVRNAQTIVYGTATNTGTVTTNNGTIVFDGGVASSPGAVVVSAGGNVIAPYVRQAQLALDGAAASPARVSLRPQSWGGQTSVVGELSINFGSVDLSDGALVVDYAGASPIDNVVGYLTTGYAAGAWTGDGINSSTAATTPQRALGFGENASLGYASFAGIGVDATAVLVRYTRYGDANLDGFVNLQDFNRLAANFGSTSARWSQGDFNYDGNVNLGDFNRLAANFGMNAAGASVTPQDWSNLAAAVPEPTTLGAVAALACVRGARRRRRA